MTIASIYYASTLYPDIDPEESVCNLKTHRVSELIGINHNIPDVSVCSLTVGGFSEIVGFAYNTTMTHCSWHLGNSGETTKVYYPYCNLFGSKIRVNGQLRIDSHLGDIPTTTFHYEMYIYNEETNEYEHKRHYATYRVFETVRYSSTSDWKLDYMIVRDDIHDTIFVEIDDEICDEIDISMKDDHDGKVVYQDI